MYHKINFYSGSSECEEGRSRCIFCYFALDPIIPFPGLKFVSIETADTNLTFAPYTINPDMSVSELNPGYYSYPCPICNGEGCVPKSGD